MEVNIRAQKFSQYRTIAVYYDQTPLCGDFQNVNIDKKKNKNNNKKHQQAYFLYSEIIHAFVRN
jgi:hypothetical protein